MFYYQLKNGFQTHEYYTGWWFGTCFIFPYIGNNNPNWLIFFFRGVQFTNQNTIRNGKLTSTKYLWTIDVMGILTSISWDITHNYNPLSTQWGLWPSIVGLYEVLSELWGFFNDANLMCKLWKFNYLTIPWDFIGKNWGYHAEVMVDWLRIRIAIKQRGCIVGSCSSLLLPSRDHGELPLFVWPYCPYSFFLRWNSHLCWLSSHLCRWNPNSLST